MKDSEAEDSWTEENETEESDRFEDCDKMLQITS